MSFPSLMGQKRCLFYLTKVMGIRKSHDFVLSLLLKVDEMGHKKTYNRPMGYLMNQGTLVGGRPYDGQEVVS